jgi:predicted RND superfamily exporter protein
VKITGWSYAMVGMIPWAKDELLLFSGAVGSLILICLGLAYRHWKPLLVHVLSLAFALGACVSLLKLTGTKINMLNALAFPLVLGVGVDYGMHLLLALKEGHTAAQSLSTVVKPLVISGLTTIAGFGALIFAQNPALNGLGTVCAIGVASCLVASVFFAVPVMVLLGNPGHNPEA